MGGKYVKNTMVEALMHFIAPHPCFGCGKIGSVLCDYCKYDIINEPFVGCILCGTPHLEGICIKHNIFIKKAYIVGRREDVLKTLINRLKFQNAKAAAFALAQLLHERLPLLPSDTLIVPIPTVSSHIRQRGYDQALLIARHFAELRSLRVAPLLRKTGTATQHFLSKQQRQSEARHAFATNAALEHVSPSTPLFVLDDVITTGATVSEAARLLSAKGNPVLVGALAYQPLD